MSDLSPEGFIRLLEIGGGVGRALGPSQQGLIVQSPLINCTGSQYSGASDFTSQTDITRKVKYFCPSSRGINS